MHRASVPTPSLSCFAKQERDGVQAGSQGQDCRASAYWGRKERASGGAKEAALRDALFLLCNRSSMITVFQAGLTVIAITRQESECKGDDTLIALSSSVLLCTCKGSGNLTAL